MARSLRPRSLDEFIGQESVKSSLRVYIESSIKRNEPLDHTLFYGPPGLGKTTLAKIISEELHVSIKHTVGPSLEKVGDIASILVSLYKGDILFIDEIHRVPKQIEEVLYAAMEDYKLPIVAGSKRSSHIAVLNLNPFTLIGATTRYGLLSPPLRDRFGIVYHLEPYSPEEIQGIILRDAEIFQIIITKDAALVIGYRSRGVPRIGIQLLKRVRDFASYQGKQIIDVPIVEEAFRQLNIDTYGLNDLDRKYLTSIIVNFQGGPVGIDALSNAINEDKGTLEEIVEPYLIKINFILRTPKGRVITKLGKEYCGLKDEKNNSLF